MRHFFFGSLAASLILIPLMATASDTIPPRTVTTTGEALIRTVPDEATISMGVEIRDPELATARERAGTIVEEFLAGARNLGIPDKDIATLGARIQPDYEWNRETGERRLRGYIVNREMQIPVTHLDGVGPLFEAATAAGVNQVQPAMLTSSRRKELERQALADATRDARQRAEAAATAVNAGVGAVRKIDASSPRVQPVARRAEVMMASDSAGANRGWQPGEINIPATVHVTFDLEP